jgi:hypothetical protein
LHLFREEVTLNLTLRVVIDEMIMGKIMVVEKLDENSVVINERACAEGICKALDGHSVVIDTDGTVDVKLFSLDGFGVSSLFSEDSESKLTVVNEHECVLLTRSILLHFFAPDVAVLLASNHLGEGVLVGLETIHHDPKFPIVLFDDGDGSGRVITDNTCDNWELGLDVL